MKIFTNQKGIALILVISAILLLTVLAFDFWKDALMGHQLAINYKARTQSFYLAKSAINFSKLIIFYDKKVKSMLAKHKMSASDLGIQPLYKQIPISSEGLRAMLQIAASKQSTPSANPDSSDTSNSDDEMSQMEQASKSISMLKSKDVETFLDFDGNFDADISEEQSKYSINGVSKMTPGSAAYDLHKKVLLSILMQPSFKNFFEDQEDDAPELVHAIADFVDSNGAINEFDKVERGSEDSIYIDGDITSKSGPMLTLSELRLIPGMNDDIYELLVPITTVYHTLDKVNVCLADTSIVDALIVHYTNYSECTTPLDPEDDAEEIERVRSEALGGCPDSNSVAGMVNAELGIQATDTSDSKSTAESKSNSSKVSGCKIQFKDMITNSNTIFRIVANGEVLGVRTVVTVILDAGLSKVKSWKTLYYQVN